MKKIDTEKSVGQKLAYDTTLVTPKRASTLLKRGHMITSSDIEKLKDSGVYQVWIEGGNDKLVYEWDISSRVAEEISDDGTVEAMKGKHGLNILISKIPGLIQIDHDRLARFNLNREVLLITRNEYEAVGKGEVVGVIDVIPLGIEKERLEEICALADKGMVRVLPFTLTKIGLIITGTEIYENRKKDQYFRILKAKCEKYGWEIAYKDIVPDDQDVQVRSLHKAREIGAEVIVITGGMSVDPTDKTVSSIKKLSAEVIAYGIPMKPTTMTLIASWLGLPIFGISAGGIHYSDFNSIDVILARIMAGVTPTLEDIAKMGDGGISRDYIAHMRKSTIRRTKK